MLISTNFEKVEYHRNMSGIFPEKLRDIYHQNHDIMLLSSSEGNIISTPELCFPTPCNR